MAKEAIDDHNPETALDIYRAVLDGRDVQATSHQRIQAGIETCRCLVLLERFEEAVSTFKRLEKTLPEEMARPESFKHVLEVGMHLASSHCPSEPILDLFQYGSKKYPDRKDGFLQLMEVLKRRRELTPEELKPLKEMGPYP